MAENDRFRVPLLHCFHDAFYNGDSRSEKIESRSDKRADRQGAGNIREEGIVMSAADRLRRKGLSESEVRQLVMNSLIDVVNTIDLQSSVDLTDLEYASKSIINYGLYDISHLTSEDMSLASLEQNVVAALLCYEPRIRKETLRVRRDTEFNDIDQKLRLSIYAEVSFLNLEVPIEFVAEIDIGASKVSLMKASNLS